MSVINQMLKELDNRKRENQSQPAENFPITNYQSEQKVSLIKMLSLITFIIFLAVLVTMAIIYNVEFFKPNTNAIPQAVTQGMPQVKTQLQVTEQDSSDEIINAESAGVESTIPQAGIAETTIADSQASEAEISESESFDGSTSIEQQQDPIEQQKVIVKTPAKISKRAQAEALFKKAKIEGDRGNLSVAKKLLKQSLVLNVNNHKARILLLSILLNLTQIDEMQTLVAMSKSQWPEVNQYRQMQARLYLQLGDQAQALAVLENDIPAVSDSADYHALLAYIAQQLKKDTLASHHYQLLLQFNSRRADWWLGLAVSEERLGNKSVALKAYNQSISQIGLTESVKNYARQRIKVIQG